MKQLIIDGVAIASMDDIHALMAKELAFPAWYGNNLDALHDCLTELHEETEVTVMHSETLLQTLGSAYSRFCRVLEDSAEENPYLHIHLL